MIEDLMLTSIVQDISLISHFPLDHLWISYHHLEQHSPHLDFFWTLSFYMVVMAHNYVMVLWSLFLLCHFFFFYFNIKCSTKSVQSNKYLLINSPTLKCSVQKSVIIVCDKKYFAKNYSTYVFASKITDKNSP